MKQRDSVRGAENDKRAAQSRRFELLGNKAGDTVINQVRKLKKERERGRARNQMNDRFDKKLSLRSRKPVDKKK